MRYGRLSPRVIDSERAFLIGIPTRRRPPADKYAVGRHRGADNRVVPACMPAVLIGPAHPNLMAELNLMQLLIVDETPADAELLEQLLRGAGYGHVVSTHDAKRLRELCMTDSPDLVLLGLDSPVADALEQIQDLIEEPDSLQVLVLMVDDEPGRETALSLGARDFVSKPIRPGELLLRVRHELETRQLRLQLSDGNALLADAVRKRTRELDTARLESLSLLASMAEYHDDNNFQHTQRVGVSAALTARALELPETFVATILDAAPLHDIGKVGISRRILMKRGELTPAEWTHMSRHVEIGARILASAQSPVLRLAAEIARTHHERWDGKGYLAGLAGEDIPLSGRITSVADVFDVLTHERPYSPIWDRERALAEIERQAGTQFDPKVVEAFASADVQASIELLTREKAQRAA